MNKRPKGATRNGMFKFQTLLAGLLACTLIGSTAILMAVTIHRENEALTASTLKKNFESARNLTITINTFKDLMFRELSSKSRYMTEGGVQIDQNPELLGTLLAGSQLFNGALVTDGSGIIRILTPETGFREGQRLDEKIVKQAIRMNRPTISAPFAVPDGHRIVLVMQPFRLPGGAGETGLIAGMIDLQANNVFSDIFEHAIKSDAGTFAYIVDTEGMPILVPDEHRIDEVVPAAALRNAFGEREVRSRVLRDTNGEESLVGYLRANGTDWAVVLQSPASFVEASKRGIIRTQLYWSVPLIAAVMLLSFWLARKLAMPFKQLTETARSISAGERAGRPPFDSHWNYEAHHLVRAMTTALKELQNQADKMIMQARTDQLTGLANRTGLAEWLSSGTVGSGGYALLVIDIDHFKSVNDQYGHAKGDETLVHLAHILQSVCGEYGLVCRLGGEEFVVVLPRMNIQSATELAERLRKQTEGTVSPTGKPITVSIGIAHTREVTQEDTFERAFRQADAALYEAKRSGRNKTMASA